MLHPLCTLRNDHHVAESVAEHAAPLQLHEVHVNAAARRTATHPAWNDGCWRALQLNDTKAGRGVSYAGSSGRAISFEQVS